MSNNDAALPLPSLSFQQRRRQLLLLAAGLVFIGIAALGIYWWVSGRFYESTDDAYVGGNVAVISPRVSGYVAQILVADNAFVHAGQPLIALDSADYNARLAAAQAQTASAQAALLRLNAQLAAISAGIDQARAQWQETTAALVFARQENQRYSNLAMTRSVSDQDTQRARTQLEQAQARQRAAEAALNVQQHQRDVVSAQCEEARASVAQSQAAERTAQLNVSYTTLNAPADGYISNRAVSPGTFVAAGTQLLSLVPAGGLWVDANFKEDQIRRMHPGQQVRIDADIDGGLNVTGHIQSLSPATGAVFSIIPAQNATGNFTKIVQRVPVRISLDPPADILGKLRPGLSVVVNVNTSGRHHE